MKYCSRIYNYLYLDSYEGNAMICPWMEPSQCSIGNILDSTVEEIWNGEKANKLREQFKQGCLDYCRKEACPYIQNNILKDIEDENEYMAISQTKLRPEVVNLAYDSVCNQYCETCRSKVFIPPKNYKEKMDTIRERITPYINTAKEINASGHGDPFASPYMMDLLSGLRPIDKNFTILLETNGVFFDEEHWERIKHLGNYNLKVVLTSNSFEEFTYKHINRGGNYKKLMHNLMFIKTLKENNLIKKYSSSFVIQDRNFREIQSFIERSLNEFGFDDVVLKPVYQWGTMPEAVFWMKDVLNPLHPYHQEYLEILEHPILKDPRVFNFGGDMMHPCREYPAKIVKETVVQKETVIEKVNVPVESEKISTTRKALAHIVSSFIPQKALRRKFRNKIMNS